MSVDEPAAGIELDWFAGHPPVTVGDIGGVTGDARLSRRSVPDGQFKVSASDCRGDPFDVPCQLAAGHTHSQVIDDYQQA